MKKKKTKLMMMKALFMSLSMLQGTVKEEVDVVCEAVEVEETVKAGAIDGKESNNHNKVAVEITDMAVLTIAIVGELVAMAIKM